MDALLGYAMAILLSLMSVGTFIKWSDTGTKNILAAAVARQNVLFNKAVEQYVQDYAATLAGLVTSSSPTTITTAMLINTGYLPSGFSSTNAYGQTWEAQILQPSSGELETMVVSTGGTAISDQLQLVKIASQVGAEGGFIPYANQGGDSTMTTSYARGAYGGWKQAMTTFTNPGSGHLASLLAFTSSSTNTNYLYRVAVTGESQLNAMQTDLSLEDTSGTKHDINDVDALNTETVDASGNMTAGGKITATGAISTSSTLTASSSITSGSTITSSGRITSGEYVLANGSATVGASCSIDAAMGSDGTQPLFCQNGEWVEIGAVPTGTTCGWADYDNNGDSAQGWAHVSACEGYIPGEQGCPSGYTSTIVATISLHYEYTCVKS